MHQKTWKSRKCGLRTRVLVKGTLVPNFGYIDRDHTETPGFGRFDLIFSKFSLTPRRLSRLIGGPCYASSYLRLLSSRRTPPPTSATTPPAVSSDPHDTHTTTGVLGITTKLTKMLCTCTIVGQALKKIRNPSFTHQVGLSNRVHGPGRPTHLRRPLDSGHSRVTHTHSTRVSFALGSARTLAETWVNARDLWWCVVWVKCGISERRS